jgi:hypothetical protein
MLRNVLATIAGLVVGSIANMAFVMLNSSVLYPMPAGTDFNDPSSFGAYVATLPVPAFFVVLLAHGSQAGVGAWVASRFSTTRGMVPAGIIGGLTALGTAMNMLSLPAPAWMWIDVPLNLALAFGGWRLAARAR